MDELQHFDEQALQRVYREVEAACGIKRPVHEDKLGISVAPKQLKFLKVYRAPGYPVDPRNCKARAMDAYVNAFSPQPAGVLDRRPLDAWLCENMN